ncbi:MAG: FAD-dependent oxidoreductase, partial [Parcubacteria group bacterium]|nr:FAD-dependent oxidoreductase [Parcubacteria group bacterium]
NFDFQKIVQDELLLVEKLRQEKYEKVLKNLEYVTAIEGKAKFVSETQVEVNGEKLSAEKFIIAAGSTANVPPIEGIREVGFITHIEALKMEKQPKELIIIGAGPLGLEFAQMFGRFGTKVTILQRGDSIFPYSEKTLTDRLAEVLIKEGIAIKTNVEVKNARLRQSSGGQARKVLVCTQADLSAETSVEADEILLAAGKTPNTQGLGLDVVDVEINKQQAVVVNQNFQTSNKNIFAVGDVTGAPVRLETTAGREGTLAAENALKGTQLFIDYNTVPYTIFTDPQLAGVGFTEDEQMKQIGVCACRTVSFADVPKAIIIHRTEGMIKMAIHPQTKQILGVHILAPNASELIAEAMMLVKNKNTIDDVVNSLPMFPTLSEAIKIVALSFTKDISKLTCCI